MPKTWMDARDSHREPKRAWVVIGTREKIEAQLKILEAASSICSLFTIDRAYDSIDAAADRAKRLNELETEGRWTWGYYVVEMLCQTHNIDMHNQNDW